MLRISRTELPKGNLNASNGPITISRVPRRISVTLSESNLKARTVYSYIRHVASGLSYFGFDSPGDTLLREYAACGRIVDKYFKSKLLLR